MLVATSSLRNLESTAAEVPDALDDPPAVRVVRVNRSARKDFKGASATYPRMDSPECLAKMRI